MELDFLAVELGQFLKRGVRFRIVVAGKNQKWMSLNSLVYHSLMRSLIVSEIAFPSRCGNQIAHTLPASYAVASICFTPALGVGRALANSPCPLAIAAPRVPVRVHGEPSSEIAGPPEYAV
jgi:hypothetical protein